MNKQDVIEILKENMIEIIPDLEEEEFSLDDSLVDIGLNSLDRGELIALTLEHLELEVSRIEFAGVDTINKLAEVFIEKYAAQQG